MRVMLRMKIFFESDKEVICFCEHLFQHNKQLAVNWQVNEKWGNQLIIQSDQLNEMIFQAVAQSLVNVYITYRLRNAVKEIIHNTYYFSEQHEIEKIYELAEWIITGEDADSKWLRDNKHPVQLLRAIFLMHIRNAQTVHYDSIVQFGMKAFKHDLIHYVGLAIDEFKREEEHQSFLNSLREYIIKKEPNVPVIHVVDGTTFSYYNDSGIRYSKVELRTIMKKAPLYLFGFPEEEWNLAPLIALAPEKIHLYVEDPSTPKTQTILNVFQEKVELKSMNEFPYSFTSQRQ